MLLQTLADDMDRNRTTLNDQSSNFQPFMLPADQQQITPAISGDIHENSSGPGLGTPNVGEPYDGSHNNRLTSIDLLLRLNIPCCEYLPSLPTSKTLEDKSIRMMTSIKDSVETNATLPYYAPDHITESPGDGQQRPLRPFTMYDPEQLLRSRYSLALRHPNLRLEILDAISKINEGSGRATVWLTCRLSHYSIADMKAKESVVVLNWRCLESLGWVCIKTSFIHGPGYFA